MSAPALTPLELVSRTAGYFERHGIDRPRLDAEVLLAHVLGLSRIDLYVHFERPVSPDERDRYRELVRSRARDRMPVAYLTGEQEFWSRPFRVTPEVLIPRPETELLVRCAADLRPRRVAEIGTGSGAVAVALACELPGAEIVAVDCSEAALEVARQNLERLGVADRVTLLCGNCTDPLAGTFDVLVSNPPYVPSEVLAGLEPEVRHEPRLALDGGPDGLDLLRRLAESAPALVPGGWLLLEIGCGQAEAVTSLLRDAGALEVAAEKDLAGIERVMRARFPGRGD